MVTTTERAVIGAAMVWRERLRRGGNAVQALGDLRNAVDALNAEEVTAPQTDECVYCGRQTACLRDAGDDKVENAFPACFTCPEGPLDADGCTTGFDPATCPCPEHSDAEQAAIAGATDEAIAFYRAQ